MGGTYQLRLRIPEDVRWAFDGTREFKRTFGTKNRADAEIKYHRLVAAFLNKIRAAREDKQAAPDPLTEEEVYRIVDDYYRRHAYIASTSLATYERISAPLPAD